MSPLQPPARILVTGANGFIATWIVQTLLDQGFSVRAAVRSLSKGKHFPEKVEVFVVEDILKDGAFDEAVKGMDGIVHTASPVAMTASDPQELIQPAVTGTLNILHSALLEPTTIKRIVITSSISAIMEIYPDSRHYDEHNWNEQALEHLKSEKPDPLVGYHASKVLAERAAWEFADKHESTRTWDLVTLHPPWVFGPILGGDVPTPSALNVSSAELYKTLFTPSYRSTDDLTAEIGAKWIDVRDLGEAHVRALKSEEAGGERVIVSAGGYVWQQWLDAANRVSKDARLVRGVPLEGVHEHKDVYDASKAERVLKFGVGDAAPDGVVEGWYKLKTIEESVKDTLEDYARRGW